MSHSGHAPKGVFSCSSRFSGHMPKFVTSQHVCGVLQINKKVTDSQTPLCMPQAGPQALHDGRGLWWTPGQPAVPLPLKSPLALHPIKVIQVVE